LSSRNASWLMKKRRSHYPSGPIVITVD
jgi:hypothetical protein